MRYTIEQLRSDPQAEALAEIFRKWISTSGRAAGSSQPAEKQIA
jgi:hypothetical protein